MSCNRCGDTGLTRETGSGTVHGTFCICPAGERRRHEGAATSPRTISELRDEMKETVRRGRKATTAEETVPGSRGRPYRWICPSCLKVVKGGHGPEGAPPECPCSAGVLCEPWTVIPAPATSEKEETEESTLTMTLHLHGQAAWHDDARIVGDRTGLERLRTLIEQALISGTVTMDFFAADGEGYHLTVERNEDMKKADHYYDLPGGDARRTETATSTVEALLAHVAALTKERDEARLDSHDDNASKRQALKERDAALAEAERVTKRVRYSRASILLRKNRELRSEAERLRAALEEIKQRTLPSGDMADQAVNRFVATVLQSSTTGLRAILGKWPGDESDAEIDAALSEQDKTKEMYQHAVKECARLDLVIVSLRDERDRALKKYEDEETLHRVHEEKRRRAYDALEKARSEAAQLRAALKEAHNAMMTWFSSEYAEHPLSKQVGDLLYPKNGNS